MIANHDRIGDGEDAVAVLENHSSHYGSAERDPSIQVAPAGIRAEVHIDRGIGVQGESRSIDRCRVAESVVGAHLDAERLAASTMVGATAVKVSAGPLVMRKFGDVQ